MIIFAKYVCNFVASSISIVKLKTHKKMLKHQLLEVLRTFTDHEKKRFGKFLNSAYFNKSPKIIKLFNILRKYHPNYDNKKITKVYIYKKLDYGLAFNDSTIRNLLYDLQIIAETYLKIKNMEFNLTESNVLQRNEFRKRELDMLYQINLENSNLDMAKRGYINSQNLLNRFRLDSDQFYFDLSLNNVSSDNYGEKADKLKNAIIQLINYFIVEFIKHNETLYSTARSYKSKQKEQYVSDFLKVINVDKLTDYVKKNSEGGFVAETYLKLLKAFMNFNNERYYKDLFGAVAKYTKKLSDDDNKYFYSKMADYNRMKSASAKSTNKYDNELFKIYEIMLKNSYYPAHYKGEIRLETYKEIMNLAIKLKKISWVQNFIADFKNKIQREYRKDVNLFSLAVLNYEKGKFKEAFDQLGKVTLDDFLYELEARSLMLKLAYHAGNLETTQRMIDGYNNYLFRHRKMTDLEKASHENFVDFMQLLLNFKKGDDKFDINLIKKKISNASNILYREWLLGKAISLSKR